MKTSSEILQDLLLKGRKVNKFTFLDYTNSVCLAQRVLELRQLGWNIRSRAIKGKGNLREYWLDREEIGRLNSRLIERQNTEDEVLVEENKKLAEMASESLESEDRAYEQLGIGLLGGKNY